MIKSGAVFHDRYEFRERIGMGGMAEVYRGYDRKLERQVAIKILKKEFREDKEFVEKFQTEARAAAGMMHPNVVNVYDVGEYRGFWYMVMELVEGITLKEYIAKKGRLSWKETVSVSIQVCNGLEATHRHGIVHRDIKPQNIIISKEGKVKVTDFGIAKAITSNTISTNMMGSVHYTSPEQARRGYSDIKSDIYSLGITIYEMVTGRLPFDGKSTVEIALKHVQTEVTPPSEHVKLPYGLEQIILKCLQKNAEYRYCDMSELALDLKHALVDPDGNFVVIGSGSVSSDTAPVYTKGLEKAQGEEAEDDCDLDEEEAEGEDVFEEEAQDNTKKLSKILKIVVIALLALSAILVIGNALGLLKIGPGSTSEQEETVEVPNLLGMTEEEATELLEEEGLVISVIKREESSEYGEGLVSEQKTGAGTKVPKGSKIQVVISSGLKAEEITVPDVSGMTEDGAKKALKNSGFTNVDSAYEYSDTVQEGDAIGTTPEAGSSAAKDAKIIVNVSKGAQKVSVPDLRGLDQNSAESKLQSAGLVGSASEEYSDSVSAGCVISQSISSGTEVSKGTTVKYVVSKGSKTVTVTMPDLVGSGYTQEEAEAVLSALGLTPNYAGTQSSSVEKGKVCQQGVKAGESVEVGKTVSFWISSGS